MKGWLSCLSEAKVLRGDGEREEFSSLSYDSRRAKAGDLFLCMKGSTMDSHDKIPELLEKGEKISLEQVLTEVKERDHRDSTRAIAPLKKAEDAIEIDSSNLSINEVVDKMLSYCVGSEE